MMNRVIRKKLVCVELSAPRSDVTICQPKKRLTDVVIESPKVVEPAVVPIVSKKLMKRTGKVAKFVDAFLSANPDSDIKAIKDAYRAKFSPKKLPGQIVTYCRQYHAHVLGCESKCESKNIAPGVSKHQKVSKDSKIAKKSSKNGSKNQVTGVFEYRSLDSLKNYWKSLKNEAKELTTHTVRDRVRDILLERAEKAQYCEFDAVLLQYQHDYGNTCDEEMEAVEKYYFKFLRKKSFKKQLKFDIRELKARNDLREYMHEHSACYLSQIVGYKWKMDEMEPEKLDNNQIKYMYSQGYDAPDVNYYIEVYNMCVLEIKEQAQRFVWKCKYDDVMRELMVVLAAGFAQPAVPIGGWDGDDDFDDSDDDESDNDDCDDNDDDVITPGEFQVMGQDEQKAETTELAMSAIPESGQRAMLLPSMRAIARGIDRRIRLGTDVWQQIQGFYIDFNRSHFQQTFMFPELITIASAAYHRRLTQSIMRDRFAFMREHRIPQDPEDENYSRGLINEICNLPWDYDYRREYDVRDAWAWHWYNEQYADDNSEASDAEYWEQDPTNGGRIVIDDDDDDTIMNAEPWEAPAPQYDPSELQVVLYYRRPNNANGEFETPEPEVIHLVLTRQSRQYQMSEPIRTIAEWSNRTIINIGNGPWFIIQEYYAQLTYTQWFSDNAHHIRFFGQAYMHRRARLVQRIQYCEDHFIDLDSEYEPIDEDDRFQLMVASDHDYDSDEVWDRIGNRWDDGLIQRMREATNAEQVTFRGRAEDNVPSMAIVNIPCNNNEDNAPKYIEYDADSESEDDAPMAPNYAEYGLASDQGYTDDEDEPSTPTFSFAPEREIIPSPENARPAPVSRPTSPRARRSRRSRRFIDSESDSEPRTPEATPPAEPITFKSLFLEQMGDVGSSCLDSPSEQESEPQAPRMDIGNAIEDICAKLMADEERQRDMNTEEEDAACDAAADASEQFWKDLDNFKCPYCKADGIYNCKYWGMWSCYECGEHDDWYIHEPEDRRPCEQYGCETCADHAGEVIDDAACETDYETSDGVDINDAPPTDHDSDYVPSDSSEMDDGNDVCPRCGEKNSIYCPAGMKRFCIECHHTFDDPNGNGNIDCTNDHCFHCYESEDESSDSETDSEDVSAPATPIGGWDANEDSDDDSPSAPSIQSDTVAPPVEYAIDYVKSETREQQCDDSSEFSSDLGSISDCMSLGDPFDPQQAKTPPPPPVRSIVQIPESPIKGYEVFADSPRIIPRRLRKHEDEKRENSKHNLQILDEDFKYDNVDPNPNMGLYYPPKERKWRRAKFYNYRRNNKIQNTSTYSSLFNCDMSYVPPPPVPIKSPEMLNECPSICSWDNMKHKDIGFNQRDEMETQRCVYQQADNSMFEILQVPPPLPRKRLARKSKKELDPHNLGPNVYTEYDDMPRWNITPKTKARELPGFRVTEDGPTCDRKAFEHFWHMWSYPKDGLLPWDRNKIERDVEAKEKYWEMITYKKCADPGFTVQEYNETHSPIFSNSRLCTIPEEQDDYVDYEDDDACECPRRHDINTTDYSECKCKSDHETTDAEYASQYVMFQTHDLMPPSTPKRYIDNKREQEYIHGEWGPEMKEMFNQFDDPYQYERIWNVLGAYLKLDMNFQRKNRARLEAMDFKKLYDNVIAELQDRNIYNLGGRECRHCHSHNFNFRHNVYICAECGEVHGGLMGGMLRGKPMYGRNVYNNNNDVRNQQMDMFDRALDVAHGVPAGPVIGFSDESSEELDADDIFAELEQVAQQEQKQNELVLQVPGRLPSPSPDLQPLPVDDFDPFADEFGEVDVVHNAPIVQGEIGSRIAQGIVDRQRAMVNFDDRPQRPVAIIGFTSSEAESGDDRDDWKGADAERRFMAEIDALEDFRPLPVAPVRAPRQSRNNMFEYVLDQNQGQNNNNIHEQTDIRLPNEPARIYREPLKGVVLADVADPLDGKTPLEKIDDFFTSVHFRRQNDGFAQHLRNNVRNLAITVYSELGMNPRFRKGVDAVSVLTQLRRDVVARSDEDVNDDMDELDIIMGNLNNKDDYLGYIDNALDFLQNLYVYNLSFRLIQASADNEQFVRHRKSIGVIVSKKAINRLVGQLNNTLAQRQRLAAEFVKSIDIYENDEFVPENMTDIQLSARFDFEDHSHMRMNNWNGNLARLRIDNLQKFLCRKKESQMYELNNCIIPKAITEAQEQREQALREWEEMNQGVDEKLAQLRVASGDCVCKYIADELNNFYSKFKGAKNVRRRILITPQQIANEFYELDCGDLDEPGFSTYEILKWARENKPGRRFISVCVFSQHKLKRRIFQKAEKRYIGNNVLTLAFIPAQNHLYPAVADKYSAHNDTFDFRKERMARKVHGMRDAVEIKEDQLDDWIDGKFDHVCYILKSNVYETFVKLYERKNVIADQVTGLSENHIDTIIHPATGFALIANPHFKDIKHICDTENSMDTNSEENPFMPELLTPNMNYCVLARALFEKYTGSLEQTPIEGGLFDDLQKYKPRALKQTLEKEYDQMVYTEVGIDFNNCYPNCLANNIQNFPLFTKFDEIKEFNWLTDDVRNDYQYFIESYEYMGFKFEARVIHGTNLKRLITLFENHELNILQKVKSYRIPKRIVFANVFNDTLSLMKREYPKSFKKLANHFIGSCNKSEHKQMFNYVSNNQRELLIMQHDIELENIKDINATYDVRTSLHEIPVADDVTLYRLCVTESKRAKMNLGYIYDVVMDNYITQIHEFLNRLNTFDCHFLYIKCDCFGVAIREGQRKDIMEMCDIAPLGSNDKSRVAKFEDYDPPKWDNRPNMSTGPPVPNTRGWDDNEKLCVCKSMYVAGAAGAGKTTSVFNLICERLTNGDYPFMNSYITAHQNKTTQDNKMKLLQALDEHDIPYQDTERDFIIIGIRRFTFDTVSKWTETYERSKDDPPAYLIYDHVIIDEISMLSTKQIDFLHTFNETYPRTVFTMAGDFKQLPAVNDRFGTYDIENSTLLKEICHYQRFNHKLVQEKSRFKNKETVEANLHFREHGRLPEHIIAMIKPCEPELNMNLVYTNKTKQAIVARKHKDNHELQQGDYVVFQICDELRESKTEEKERSKAKAAGYYVGGTYKIIENDTELKAMIIGYINDDDHQQYQASYKNLISTVVSTVHKSQGGKIPGAGNIWEWEKMDKSMRYTALTRFTDIRDVRINNPRAPLPNEDYNDDRAKGAIYKKNVPQKMLFYKGSMDTYVLRKYDVDKTNLTEEQAKPRYMLFLNKMSKDLFNQYISIINGEVDEQHRYMQLCKIQNTESMVDREMQNIVDEPAYERLVWKCPYVTFKNGVKYPVAAKFVRIKYNDKTMAEARAQIRAQIVETLNDITRVDAEQKYPSICPKLLALGKGKPVVSYDSNQYYERIVDTYDHKDEKQSELCCEPWYYNTMTRQETRNPFGGTIRLRHHEHIRMNKPLHTEMVAGITSNYRTFKNGNYGFFNETFEGMCNILLAKNQLRSDGLETEHTQSYYQEICTVNSRMYFDLDIPESAGKNSQLVLKQFLAALRHHFKNMSNDKITLNQECVRVCKSTSKKVSYHISVLDHVFPTPDHQVLFTRKLVEYIKANNVSYSELLWNEEDVQKCAVDDNAYHIKQSVRCVFSRKKHKDNTLIPYKLHADDTITEDDFKDYDLYDPENNLDAIHRLQEYLICASFGQTWSFSCFSKISDAKRKKGKHNYVAKQSNCNKKQLKQVKELMRNIKGFDLDSTQAEYDLDGKFVKYSLRRCEKAHCPYCNKPCGRQNACLQEYHGIWKYTCYQGGHKSVVVAV